MRPTTTEIDSPMGPLCLLLMMSIVCVFGGCAAEAPPRPPRIQIPQTVHDLTAIQVGRELILNFHTPTLATDGRGLTKPLSVEILRSLQPSASLAAVPSAVWIHLNPRELAAINHSGEATYRTRYTEADLIRIAGSIELFRVVTLTRGFRGRARRSEPSNVAQIELLNVPPPVQGLLAVQRPGQVALRWAAPQEKFTAARGLSVDGYRIYRGIEGEPGSVLLIGQSTLPEYQDARFQFGRSYMYFVRVVVSQGRYQAETADSAPAVITLRAIFPPPAPTGLVAVFTGHAVRLSWRPEVQSGIAGYNVYRETAGTAPRRLNQKLLRTPTFTDASPALGMRYDYWVTAVDQADNESKASAQARVTAR